MSAPTKAKAASKPRPKPRQQSSPTPLPKPRRQSSPTPQPNQRPAPPSNRRPRPTARPAGKLPPRKSPGLAAASAFRGFGPADWLVGCVLFAAAAFIPLVVRYAERPVGPDQAGVFSGASTIDMFSYYKSVLILCAAAILAACAVYRLIALRPRASARFFLTPLHIAAAVFIFFALLSLALSPYKYTAIHGVKERFESVFVLIGYFALFFAALAFAKSLFKVKFLLWAVLISCFAVGLIGFLQFAGHDPFKTELFRRLVLGSLSKTDAKMTFNFTKVYSTLYNPNCVGAYTALMMPLCAAGAFFAKKDVPLRAAFAVDALLMFVCWIGCGSAGGFMGAAAALLAVLVTYVTLLATRRLKIKPNPKILPAAGAILLAAVLACVLVKPVRNGLSQTAGKLLDINSTQSANFFRDLAFDGGTATISTINGDVSLSYDGANSTLAVTGPDGGRAAPLKAVTAEDTGVVTANYSIDGFGGFQILTQSGVVIFRMNGIDFRFAIDASFDIVPVSSSWKTLDPNTRYRAVGFEGKELLGSGRGFIWSRTIPLMLDHPLVGSGADTFILAFPQDDIIGKTRYMGNPYILVDKAHNLFMLTAVNTGGLSMLALIFIFGLYVVTAFVSILRARRENAGGREDAGIWGLRLAIMAGVVGYAAASLSTDSTVSVAPVFWIALGVGFALNKIRAE
ncbi:MAG: O-antigen ligase family protein [Firmicutes bacterium]|nr:O-antigen ligase family protein [Bacillota bacterium]